MNNSSIAHKPEEPEVFQKRRGELTQIVEAINGVEASAEWQKLKNLVLDGVVANLERLLMNESSRKEICPPEIYRLQGQLVWARRYADLRKLSETFRLQLEKIKNQINEKNPRDGAL